jgi:phage terminase small subunit
MTTLNAKQRRFIDEYLIDLNATAAYKRAGYRATGNAAEVNAARLLRHAKVKAIVDERMAARSNSTQITADRVLREIARVAFLDIRGYYRADGSLKSPHELTDDQAAALASVESFEEFEGVGDSRCKSGDVRKIKMWDKMRALIELSKHLGLAPERHEVTGRDGGPIAHTHEHTLTEPERLARLAELLDRARTRSAGQAADGPAGSGK